MSRNVDLVWHDIFNDFDILIEIEKNGFFEISSKQIKKYYEPRLVTKFDYEEARPIVMQSNNISILPNTTGTYILGHFDTFLKFPKEPEEITTVTFPEWIQSIDINAIQSESVAISAATISPIFEDFFNDTELISTVSGRMGSGQWDFLINDRKIHVASSQIEIDGALESPNRFVLLEGKNVLHDNFLIRQLYYPFRTYESKIKNKPIHNVFITYSNGIFRLMEYEFADALRYDSCKFLRQKRYKIDNNHISINDLKALHSSTKVEPEPEQVPFPQCDDFSKIIGILEMFNDTSETAESEIVDLFSFTGRQGNYYFNGVRYLGLVDKNKGKIELTAIGSAILKQSLRQRQLTLAQQIIKHKVFHQLLGYYLNNQKMPDKNTIVKVMSDNHVCDSEVTIQRRASTTAKWLKWVISIIDS